MEKEFKWANLLFDILVLIGLGFVIEMVRGNLLSLNSFPLPLRTGSFLLIVLLALSLTYIYYIIRDLVKGIRGLRLLVKAAAILVLLVVGLFLYDSYFPTLRQTISAENLNPLQEKPLVFNETELQKPEVKASYSELQGYALALINADRKKAGLPAVELGTNNAAQRHAEDMLKNRFLSHWGTDGYKPYMRYSREGMARMAENAAFSGFYYDEPRAVRIDPKVDMARLQYEMVYNDSDSNWGHRNTTLDKYHNKVNIGIAYEETRLALVQDFESDYILWAKPITYEEGVLSMSGKALLGTVKSVALYYDPLPEPLTHDELLQKHGGAYGLGELAGAILPPNYVSETPFVNGKFRVNEGNFDISADVSPLIKKPGVYTVIVVAEEDKELVPLTTYSLFVTE